MKFIKPFLTTTFLFLIIFISTIDCVNNSFVEANHTHSSHDSGHEISEFEPFREIDSVVATVSDKIGDGVFDFSKFDNSYFTASLLVIILSLFLSSKRRIFQLIYNVPRLFNKWKYILKKGIIHPQFYY